MYRRNVRHTAPAEDVRGCRVTYSYRHTGGTAEIVVSVHTGGVGGRGCKNGKRGDGVYRGWWRSSKGGGWTKAERINI